MTDECNQLREAVEKMHGGTASPVQTHETFEGQTVWEGVVHVFEANRTSEATRAYAWSSPVRG